MSKKEKKQIPVEEPIHLDIPEDEIWTYQVEGLSAPHIGKKFKHYGLKKMIFAIVIIIAVSISCYFSVRTVQKDTFEYKQTEAGFELEKFSNTGFITTLDIDFVSSIEYDRENPDVNTNFNIIKNDAKPVCSVGAYALNCDEKVKIINIGEGVDFIDPKAFYSCWALQQIEVDNNNPNYCDIDGVLYNKDKTEIICRPCDHDTYLAEKYGYAEYDEGGFRIEPSPEDDNYEQYVNDVLTFVVPSTVETVGELCFNYANMKNIYLPEGLKTIETLGFFEIPLLENVFSYKTSSLVSESHFVSEDLLGEVYLSLPEGLEYIGSDAFSYNQALTYVYIPESVKYIGHHAFWDTVYKDGDALCGVSQIDVASSENSFKSNVETGDSWRPQYDFLLFKKSIDVIYEAQRAK